MTSPNGSDVERSTLTTIVSDGAFSCAYGDGSRCFYQLSGSTSTYEEGSSIGVCPASSILAQSDAEWVQVGVDAVICVR